MNILLIITDTYNKFLLRAESFNNTFHFNSNKTSPTCHRSYNMIKYIKIIHFLNFHHKFLKTKTWWSNLKAGIVFTAPKKNN